MAIFDHDVWAARAWDRHNKTIQAGGDAEKSSAKWAEEVKAIGALRVVVDWCAARSLIVTFSKRSGAIFFPSSKEIKISGRASPIRQLHCILHECGHCLIGDKDKTERFGMGYGNEDKHAKKTMHHRVDILEEEFEAWHRGWKLAKRLKVLDASDKASYDKTRVSMLMTYVKWATRDPEYKTDLGED